MGKAAKDWPQLNFIIYHGGYRWAGGGNVDDAWAQFERTGRIEWVTDLAEIPAKYGVKNVYADVGQLFAQSTIADPRVAAVMMGQLIKGLGADHVCWGTDAIWTGSPQWQIEAFRRLEIPEELQKKYGLTPLGPANGPVKNAWLWFVDGEFAHLATGAADFDPSRPSDDQFYMVVDVRNPRAPREVGRWWLPGTRIQDSCLPGCLPRRQKLDDGYWAHSIQIVAELIPGHAQACVLLSNGVRDGRCGAQRGRARYSLRLLGRRNAVRYWDGEGELRSADRASHP